MQHVQSLFPRSSTASQTRGPLVYSVHQNWRSSREVLVRWQLGEFQNNFLAQGPKLPSQFAGGPYFPGLRRSCCSLTGHSSVRSSTGRRDQTTFSLGTDAICLPTSDESSGHRTLSEVYRRLSYFSPGLRPDGCSIHSRAPTRLVDSGIPPPWRY